MTKSEYELVEVKPESKGFYQITLSRSEKEKPEHPDYIKDWFFFDGENWDYTGWGENVFACCIHKKDEME
jgi:hypothetical protein